MFNGRPGFNPNRSGGSPYASPPHMQNNSPSFRPMFSSPPNFRPNFSPRSFNGSPRSSMSPNFNSPARFSSTPRQYKPWSNDRRSWGSNQSYDNNRSSFNSSQDGMSPNWHGPNRTQNSSWGNNRSFGSRIEDYVDPSMLVDPWADLEQQLVTKVAANSSDE